MFKQRARSQMKKTELMESWMSSNSTFSPKEKILNTSFSIETTIAQQLKQRWDKAVNVLFFQFKNSSSSSPSSPSKSKSLFCSDSWYQQIKSFYSNESERKYHTIWHLVEMFGYLDILFPIKTIGSYHKKDHEVSVAILTMSIFFHDAIYNPKSSTNEEDSAILYTQFRKEMEESYLESSESSTPITMEQSCSSLNFSSNSISPHDIISNFIIETKSHSIPSKPNKIYDEETLTLLQIFMDMDLSVLAKTPKAYDNYAYLIRQEYRFVERSIYCSKRVEILQDFLTHPSIFHSNAMTTIQCSSQDDDATNFCSLEERSRMNLKREIECLQNGIIPGENDVVDKSKK